MDVRRRRAIVLATLPVSLLAGFVSLMPRVSGNHAYQVVFGICLLLAAVCLVIAMRNIIALKRDGNPY